MSTPPSTSRDLARILGDFAEKIRSAYPVLEKPRMHGSNLLLLRAIRENKGMEDELRSAVQADESFGLLRGGWISFFGSGHSIDSRALSFLLLSEVLSGDNPESVVSRVREFSSHGTCSGFFYFALSGVRVETPVQLSEDLSVVPWELVADCDQKSKFSVTDSQRGAFSGFHARPNCALRISISRRAVLSDVSDRGAGMDQLHETKAFYDRAEAAIRALTLAARGPVGLLGAWPQPSEPIFIRFFGSNFSYGRELHDPIILRSSLVPLIPDVSLVLSLFSRMASFSDRSIVVWNVAVDRVCAALRQTGSVNKAIDLGVALEIMLLHEVEGTHRGELKYRASVRGAQFLGGSTSERLSNFKVLKDVYDLRSKAVHEGRLKGSESEERTLKAATLLVVLIAIKVMELGRFPNWEEEFIFSDGAG